MQRVLPVIIFGGIIAFSALSTGAATIHVPADQLTIQAGINVAINGDTVLVAPGSYTGPIIFGGKLIVVMSAGGAALTSITADPTTNLVLFTDNETSAAILEGFRLDGGLIAILCENAGPTIRHNILVDQNITNWGAISLGGDGYGTVGASPAVIVNNTIVNCANGGISTFSSVAPTIKNNIIVSNDHYGIHREGTSQVAQPILSYNDIFGNPVSYQQVTDSGIGTINADPLFVPSIPSTFLLSLGSPCIDAGDPDPSFNDPDDTRNDMGAIQSGICLDSSDTDGDGLKSCIDNCPVIANAGQEDADNDFVGDACDLCPDDPLNDSDDDGHCYNVDNCPTMTNPDQNDSDGDGVGDGCDNCPGFDNSIDEDADGVADACDVCPGADDMVDSDFDAIPNGCDDCPFDALNDDDGDGFCADVDNCPTIFNPDQLDSDSDGFGDACECCKGLAGNVDFDPFDRTDITDLTFLIDHLMINFPRMECPAEGNIDGDPNGSVDIADLTFLIDHLFINFPQPAPCQ